jgi:glycosyltransferase involved in cell wall biosynthesis
MKKVLLNCSTTKLEDMLEKGNVWYTVHYRQYFDEYICGYLLGRAAEPLERDGVRLVPLGTGKPMLDLLMAPIRVYRVARRVDATHYTSADLLLSWWHFSLARLLCGAQLMLNPVCNPKVTLETTGKTFSGLPLWIERALIYLSLRAADRILCVRTNPAGLAWLTATGFGHKVTLVDVLPEEFSAPEFLEQSRSSPRAISAPLAEKSPVHLIYVGRLEREKLIDDLIDAMIHLHALRKPFVLTVVGDGSERHRLEQRVTAAGLADRISFTGFLQAGDVAGHFKGSDICVSPYTGTSLREAALMGLAIVAYRLGGIEDLFQDGKHCLLVTAGDSKGLAEKIAELIDVPARRFELATNAQTMAQRVWSSAALRVSLREAFEAPIPGGA